MRLKIGRKAKREYNKLDNTQKAEVINKFVQDKVSNVMANQIAKAMIDGMALVYEKLYNEYVAVIKDEAITPTEREYKTQQLLKFIEHEHTKFDEKKAQQIEVDNNA